MKRISGRILFMAACVFMFLGCGRDTDPPTTPTNLTVIAVSPTEVQVTWTASEDDRGVEGYKVFRNGSFLVEVAASGLVDSGLTPSTRYCYAVSAFDEEGNESDISDAKCDTTLLTADTQAPTTPAALAANPLSSTEIELSWNASTDNIGVTGYNIYDGVSDLNIGTVTVTSFVHNGLTPSTTYSYYVTAFDKVGNESAPTATVSASTQP